jgi:deoxyribodipyrimidine photolyase-related protein
MEVSLIFPQQIYEFNPCITTKRKVYIIEDHLFFTQFRFHKQKLVLHRATMKFYEDYLRKYGFDIEYIEFSALKDLDDLFRKFAQFGVKKIHHVETVDNCLEKSISENCKKYKISRKLYNTPVFLNKHDDLVSLFENKKYDLNQFYKLQKNIFENLNYINKSKSGKWDLTIDKRKKIQLDIKFPKTGFPEKHKYTYEAIDYVEKNFQSNPGNSHNFCYPVTFVEAINFLDDFLKNKFGKYGEYQDLIISDQVYLFHSVLSPIINCGMLSPEYIVQKAMEVHTDYEYNQNSLDYFIHRIIVWREFIRAVYVLEGSKLRTKNNLKFHKEIPISFWNATTGIKPVDDSIGKVLDHAWCNSSERLMILGNFMLLCEFNPNSVYSWFMQMFVDTYDWASVPNVYGFSQFSDAGLINTKPFITNSSYIIKVSDYQKGEWSEIWDSLYWRFLTIHRNILAKFPNMKNAYNQLDELNKKKLSTMIEKAETYLKNLNS